MPSKSQLMTVALTLVAIMVINKVPQLNPVRKVVLTDGSWFS